MLNFPYSSAQLKQHIKQQSSALYQSLAQTAQHTSAQAAKHTHTKNKQKKS